jgi:putative phage-type endonuclease
MLIQGSAEWKAARVGSLGASAVYEALARTKTGFGAGRANCMARLLVERLTGVPQDTYTTAAMQHGIAMEPEARDAYAFYADADVEECGLFTHPTIKGTHASPDGLVGDDGLVEIKCCQPPAHLDVLLSGAVPARYATQALWQMACTGRTWCDVAFYQPTFPADMRLWVNRIPRDDVAIATLERNVRDFLAELDDKLAKLTGTYNARLVGNLAASAQLAEAV